MSSRNTVELMENISAKTTKKSRRLKKSKKSKRSRKRKKKKKNKTFLDTPRLNLSNESKKQARSKQREKVEKTLKTTKKKPKNSRNTKNMRNSKRKKRKRTKKARRKWKKTMETNKILNMNKNPIAKNQKTPTTTVFELAALQEVEQATQATKLDRATLPICPKRQLRILLTLEVQVNQAQILVHNLKRILNLVLSLAQQLVRTIPILEAA